MADKSSPDPLSANGGTRHVRLSSKARSKGSSPDHYPEDGSQAEDSPSSAESQPLLLSQLKASQPNVKHVIQDDGNEQYHVSQARGHGSHPSGHPEDDPKLGGEIDTFVFGPQPKYKPNQFSGHQQRRSINFSALSGRQDAVPQEDWANAGNVRPAQPQDQPALIDDNSHHYNDVDTHANNMPAIISRSDQGRRGTPFQRLRAAEVNPEQSSSHGQLLGRGLSDQITTSSERDSAGKSVSRRPSVQVEQKIHGSAIEDRSIRPFADADVILPCDQRETLQPAIEQTATDRGIPSQRHSSREENEGEQQQCVVSDRDLEPRLFETSKPVDDNRAMPRQIARVQRQHHEAVEIRSSTPVGDLEMPQKQTPGSARKSNRQHSSPREQSIRRISREQDARDVPQRTKSRLSNTSRRRKRSHRQSQHGKPSQEKANPGLENQQVTAESHYEALESMSAHYNKVLSYSKEVEHNMNSRLLGQKQQIEELVTRLQQYQARYQKDCDRRVQSNSELSLLQHQKDELSHNLAQQGGRLRELEQELADLQAEREMQDKEAVKLHQELEVTHSKLDKFQEKSRSYKDHLNKAVAEHQQLWQHSKDIAQKTITSMREEHEEAEEKFKSAMAEKQAAQDKLNLISKHKQVVLQQEVAAAASKIRGLTSALDNLGKDFDFEAQRAKKLEGKLLDADALKGLLRQIDENVTGVCSKVDKMQARSLEAPAVPTEVMRRLDEIAGHVQCSPQVNVEDEIQRALETFQKEMMPQFLEKLKPTMTGQSIEEKLQSLQETFQKQSLSMETERKHRQEQLMLQLSERKNENSKLAQDLLAKDAEIADTTSRVSELDQKLREARESAELASRRATTMEEKLQELQQSLLSKDCQVAETQTELQLQRQGHETKIRELQEKLRIAEENGHLQRQRAEDSEKNLAKRSGEDAEIQMRLESSEESLHQAQQQLTMAGTEVERLKTLDSVIRASKLEKELENAHQRVTNLTLKLRDTQAPAANNGQLDQVAEQLAQLQTLREEVKQLRSNGKAYAAVSKDFANTLDRQNATGNDDVLIPDSLVLPEPMLPVLLQQDVYDPLNDFQPSSSDMPLIRASKRTVFRSPVEESEDEMPAPSVEQEKSQRMEVAAQGSNIRSILRPQKTPVAKASKGSNGIMVARHAGHSSYNRPVQSAPKSSQEAILDVKNSLVGNRKGKLGDLTNPNEWERLDGPASLSEQRGTKRSNNAQQWSRGSKRSKPCFTENEGNRETSQAAGGNNEDCLRAEPPERNQRDGNRVVPVIVDDDQVSHHFFPSTSKPNEGTR
ncbi:hypothetical protein HER10_EVM0012581 [Colletotrichum scovillei]|uniref:uncharacterized protein n=1 Tax=Colletotrichum scovillei TaxID=1209932 RepID=UPI0015C3E309|nr:uncharacterized protein HER10_EVM0012581 [Colletotrichum scovillei]KAF4777225.1 hypothetical protein HER10_EVM0012581 [Colletotrichum scovillei]